MFNLKSFKYNNKYNNRNPSFPRPKIVGYFSIDAENSYCSNLSKLKYFHQGASIKKDVKFDLNYGRENTTITDSLEKNLDHTLLWIQDNVNKIKADDDDDEKWIKPDFICSRGVLTSIMKSIYHPKEPWTILAAKFRGTIYMKKAPRPSLQYNNMDEEQKKFQEWGLKFGSFLLTDDPTQPPDPSLPTNEKETFSCIFKTNLNNKKLLYEAMVDGVVSNKKLQDPIQDLNKLELIELKTSKEMNPLKSPYINKYKSLNTWASCFLTGISKIIYGFRNSDGIVERIVEYNTSKLKEDNKDHWDGVVCMNLLDQILDYLKFEVVLDHDEAIYQFERFSFEDQIEVSQLDAKNSFLPEWFTKSTSFP
ncbi:hypothetical protein HCN44_005816 [Aphidius gifuensis]|uniref:Decapping nuclease n=1 Tax=Aphidius gifuensis TaxID=684658 RepID=A0A835CU70_APHGI|nr:decapping and exoribonuclease protein-like [Aphidius gifuensis]KAF7993035.1 hypothetical protein HCN44_005816 [Aphidius gifuensis]